MVRGNVNCPAAVVRAASVFVLRTLLDDDVPTNDGIARALDLRIPPGCAIDARWPAAVAAGNVEMSQRITDTLFAALADAGVDVPAQGTGDDEQHHVRRRRLDLLRDTRRWPGRELTRARA
jgi:N-methylhydantoinase B/oxoprolinase/acetone carboxylase alpha subunit